MKNMKNMYVRAKSYAKLIKLLLHNMNYLFIEENNTTQEDNVMKVK